MKTREQAVEYFSQIRERLAAAASVIGAEFMEAHKLLGSLKGSVVAVGVDGCAYTAAKGASSFRCAGLNAFSLTPSQLAEWKTAAKGDILVVVSPSGESESVIGCVPALKKRGVKVIVITSLQRSTLARAADIVLRIPQSADGPDSALDVTSGLSSLIILELLAMMSTKQTTARKTAAPSSTSGEAYRVADVMASRPKNPVVSRDRVVKDALAELTSKGLGAVSVVDENGKLIGIVTDGDVRRLLQRSVGTLSRIFLTSVEKIMSPNPRRTKAGDSVASALQMMEKTAITVLPVVNERDEPLGMVHLHDMVQISILKMKPKVKK